MKTCAGNGWLVGMQETIPDDPRVAYEGRPPLIGCSNIVCTECKQQVRHVDRHRLPQVAPVSGQLAQLHGAPDPAALGILVPAPNEINRVYFCRCTWASTGGAIKLEYADQPWECGGHPD